ncbi:sentrin-specific protease 7-like isoform X2 [Brachyistius frenatus]|uniref:sentrin-specific protease 7-like isoform X2 n=1 Tax=Brachyistius frenatus TaxID=100188 RepID=UPI0037E99324
MNPPESSPTFNRNKAASGPLSAAATGSFSAMATPFKIPKTKRPADSDSAHIHMQSPLSRLQSFAPHLKGYRDQPGRGAAGRMHAGNALGSSTDLLHRTTCRPLFRDVLQTMLGPIRGGASAANHRSTGSRSGQSQQGQKVEPSSACFSNGWRPKRASDRLLSERLSPPQKKSGAVSSGQSICVEALDSLAELRGDGHAGSLSSSTPGVKTWRKDDSSRGSADGQSDTGSSPESPLKPQKKKPSVSSSDQTSEDDFLSPSRTRTGPSAGPTSDLCRPSSSSSSESSPRTTADRRHSLERVEAERERWREFREKRRPTVPKIRLRKPKPILTEPIVLSSEEEGEGERGVANGEAARGTSQRNEDSQRGRSETVCPPPPSFLQLDFASLHAGLTSADANGKMMITENGITFPLKGPEDGEVMVVASQVRGYGLWDGGVAQGGALLAGWEGPAPSLLFLWVTDAQANLLQRELLVVQAGAARGPPCSFLLVVLKEQLPDLQAVLLASMLEMEEYQSGRSSPSSSSRGPASPLDWTDGLLLLHSCPPPLDQHLLRLLGHSAESVQRSSRTRSSLTSGLQQPTRLVQYPLAPCRGRITVTSEDLACLDHGEFLNDVIIDFYLKFLLLEGGGGSVSERSHVFSSFFFKQLSRRQAAGEDDAPSVPDRQMRHQRVKTWTRHVDIFTKDFLFVPVNQEAHWFLVVVCFPGQQDVRYDRFQRRAGGSQRAAGKPNSSLRLQQPPDCSELGCYKDSVMKRPCLLVMDSLKLSYHENVCRLLRDYLQVEWEVRRRSHRLFSADSMRSCSCRVPQQDNSSDCGVFLLQYVESFLQNPVVHFDLPLRLDGWFPRQQVRQKREEIRSLILKLQRRQLSAAEPP